MLRFTRTGAENVRFGSIAIGMFILFFKRPIAALSLAYMISLLAFGQPVGSPGYNAREVSENGEVPVLIQHLPDWERVREQTTYAKSVGELRSALGERAVLDQIDFVGGTEAVTAPYPAGKLLIIEFATPQASIESDAEITSTLAGLNDAFTVYRRIGNYNVFVFDATDPTAANALLDQVKYEKTVQWLGKNPYQISAERAFVITTTDIFVSTVIAIVLGMGTSLFLGVIAGFIFFTIRERKRAGMQAFSDAGGITRLNLDGFTPEIVPERLLKD